MCKLSLISIFFFNDTATTAIYTYLHPLSLHDALPIWPKIPSSSWHCLMFKDDVCCFQCQRNGAFHRIENVSGLHDILLSPAITIGGWGEIRTRGPSSDELRFSGPAP